MTEPEIKVKVMGFAHGVQSDGTWLLPWRHDEGCVWCDKLTRFIETLFGDRRRSLYLDDKEPEKSQAKAVKQVVRKLKLPT